MVIFWTTFVQSFVFDFLSIGLISQGALVPQCSEQTRSAVLLGFLAVISTPKAEYCEEETYNFTKITLNTSSPSLNQSAINRKAEISHLPSSKSDFKGV